MKKIIYSILFISVCIVPLSSFSFSFSKVDTTTRVFKISKYIKNNLGVGVGTSFNKYTINNFKYEKDKIVQLVLVWSRATSRANEDASRYAFATPSTT